jgi:hypothetical protein
MTITTDNFTPIYIHNMKLFLILTALFLFGCNPKRSSDGQRISYYPDKKVKSIMSYEGGVLNGPAFWFYPNGKMEQSSFIIDGEAEWHAYFFSRAEQ